MSGAITFITGETGESIGEKYYRMYPGRFMDVKEAAIVGEYLEKHPQIPQQPSPQQPSPQQPSPQQPSPQQIRQQKIQAANQKAINIRKIMSEAKKTRRKIEGPRQRTMLTSSNDLGNKTLLGE